MNSPRTRLALGLVVVLAVAVIVGLQLRDRNSSTAEPSPSTTPSGTATAAASASATASSAVASPGATATAASSAIYNDDFGFIVTETGRGALRKESSDSRIATISVNSQQVAVAPDGKRVAYWKLDNGLPGDVAQLRMFSTLGNATEETLVTLAAGQRGGGVAWSSDGAGLLYSTETGSFGVGGDGKNSATLNLWELAAGSRRGTIIDSQTNTGWLYRPVAWDRSANLAAAGLTGEGGAMAFYVTVRINPDNTFNAQRVDTRRLQDLNGMSMGSIRASSDAKFVLGVEGESGSIRWWPIADFAAIKSQAGAGKGGALWRPGTHEIGFMGPSDQFWLGDVDKVGSLGLCCTAFSGAPAGSVIVTFRADGSAVVLAVRGTANEYTLVRLGTDPKSTTGDRVTFKDAGTVIASVKLR